MEVNTLMNALIHYYKNEGNLSIEIANLCCLGKGVLVLFAVAP